MFTGKLVEHGANDLLHDRSIPPGHGKFLIKSVFLNKAMNWVDYNEDIFIALDH